MVIESVSDAVDTLHSFYRMYDSDTQSKWTYTQPEIILWT